MHFGSITGETRHCSYLFGIGRNHHFSRIRLLSVKIGIRR